MNPHRSDFLYASPSFLRGMGSVLSIAGNYYEYNASSTPEEADAKALFSDFAMIGEDLREVIAVECATKTSEDDG
jgi:hypothetical protein